MAGQEDLNQDLKGKPFNATWILRVVQEKPPYVDSVFIISAAHPYLSFSKVALTSWVPRSCLFHCRIRDTNPEAGGTNEA